MCDALVAMGDATPRGSVVFGKNSDRPVDDCQVLVAPGAGAPGETIRCSYVTIRREKEAVPSIGCRPYWCWGYETGINEAGVVGGNTAIYTKALRESGLSPGLTGMDLLRLGLESCTTASEAVETITTHLERHGQWGSGVPGQAHAQGSYDNAFLLADRSEAWVLETAGKRWVAQRVTEGVRTISNELSIRDRGSRASADLVDHARDEGWWAPDEGTFDFALACADHRRYARQVSHIRRMRSTALLESAAGAITPERVMSVLRDHYEGSFLGGPQFHPFLPDFHTLCMHDSPAGFTWGNTATSFVVELRPEESDPPVGWLCYGPPCCGVYFPFGFGVAIPEWVNRVGQEGDAVRGAPEVRPDRFHPESLWWRFRRLVDAVAQRPHQRRPQARETFDPIERDLLAREREVHALSADARRRAIEDLVQGAQRRIHEALGELESAWGLAT